MLPWKQPNRATNIFVSAVFQDMNFDSGKRTEQASSESGDLWSGNDQDHPPLFVSGFVRWLRTQADATETLKHGHSVPVIRASHGRTKSLWCQPRPKPQPVLQLSGETSARPQIPLGTDPSGLVVCLLFSRQHSFYGPLNPFLQTQDLREIADAI